MCSKRSFSTAQFDTASAATGACLNPFMVLATKGLAAHLAWRFKAIWALRSTGRLAWHELSAVSTRIENAPAVAIRLASGILCHIEPPARFGHAPGC